MDGENAAGGQHYNEWLNFSLSKNIPRKVAMGENLKLAWTSTGNNSPQPLVITLSDEVQLELHWQEYRWVTELELLGQITVNGDLILLSERQLVSTGDDKRPHIIHDRTDQKSICVTRLVAALHDPVSSGMTMKQISQHVFHIQFNHGGHTVKFAVDVEEKTGVIYSSDCGQFPTIERNEHSEGLLEVPTTQQLLDRAAKATDSSQTQAALTVGFSVGSGKPTSGTVEGSTWNEKGRIPPFDASGKKRVDVKNAYIKAPFAVETPPSHMIAPNMTPKNVQVQEEGADSMRMGTRKAATQGL